MKLADLDPRWVTVNEQRVGVSFECPACRGKEESDHGGRVFVYVDPPLDAGPPSPTPAWSRSGETFETLTLTPSIDAPGCWHGFITDGQVTP